MRRALVMAVLVIACGDAGSIEATPVGTAPTATTASQVVWNPAPATTWQWQLSGTIDRSLSVDMYDIDLFDSSRSTIADLHAEDRIVVCYFSAGSHEDWRPDAEAFPVTIIGAPLDGWPGERWLDIRRLDLLGPVLEERLDLAVDKDCDGVEPDNVDGYLNDSGFALAGDDQLAFNRWLAAAAHERGLSIGLKNDLDQIPELVDDFDWLLVEQCVEFDECDLTAPFVVAGKAVFAVEYSTDGVEACFTADAFDLSLIGKDLDLGPAVEFCD